MLLATACLLVPLLASSNPSNLPELKDNLLNEDLEEITSQDVIQQQESIITEAQDFNLSIKDLGATELRCQSLLDKVQQPFDHFYIEYTQCVAALSIDKGVPYTTSILDENLCFTIVNGTDFGDESGRIYIKVGGKKDVYPLERLSTAFIQSMYMASLQAIVVETSYDDMGGEANEEGLYTVTLCGGSADECPSTGNYKVVDQQWGFGVNYGLEPVSNNNAPQPCVQ